MWNLYFLCMSQLVQLYVCRNVWSMKLRVQDQGEDQRRPGKRLYVRTVKHVSWIKRMPCHGPLQMEKGDKGSTMIRMGVSGWMFLLVPAYPGCPGSKAVKRSLSSVLWCCWLGGRKVIWPVKNWVVGCWHGYLSGSRCKLAIAYGPADGTATHCLLLHLNPDWFCLLVLAHLGSPRQRVVKWVCVCVSPVSVLCHLLCHT